MKQINFKIVQRMFTLFLVVGAVSCSSDTSEVKDSKDIAETHNEAKFENSSLETDAQFLVNAAEINLQEMNLGLLAQQKSSNADVVALGKMVADAHAQSMTDLKALAIKKNITIPVVSTESAGEAFDELNAKQGNDFNKKFCDLMVEGHKKAVTVFENATTDAVDVDVKNWAITSLPLLRIHSDKAISCQTKVNAVK